MATQLHNFKNIFIASSADSQAISLDCQAVRRLTRALFPLLQRPRYSFALLRECLSHRVLGHFVFEVGPSPVGLGREMPTRLLPSDRAGRARTWLAHVTPGLSFWGLRVLGAAR